MQLSGILAILAAMVGSRFISERAYRQLNSDEKLRLMDGFSSTRMYSMIPLFALVAGFLYLTTQTDVDKQLLTTGYFGLLAVYIIVRTVMNQRKLVLLEMPHEYRRSFMVAQAVSLIGVAWFFYAIF